MFGYEDELKNRIEQLERALHTAEQSLTGAISALTIHSPAYRDVKTALEQVRAALGVEPRWLDPNNTK